MAKKSGKKIIICLLAIFILPVIFARIVFYGHSWFSLKTINHGQLIVPAVSVKSLYQQLGGRGRWLVLHRYQNKCDANCNQLQWYLGQVKKALGKNSERVIIVSQSTVRENKLPIGIYLIDPRGFLFMRYNQNTAPMSVLKDMQRVLEVSQIG